MLCVACVVLLVMRGCGGEDEGWEGAAFYIASAAVRACVVETVDGRTQEPGVRLVRFQRHRGGSVALCERFRGSVGFSEKNRLNSTMVLNSNVQCTSS